MCMREPVVFSYSPFVFWDRHEDEDFEASGAYALNTVGRLVALPVVDSLPYLECTSSYLSTIFLLEKNKAC